jgi:hypothetical protein
VTWQFTGHSKMITLYISMYKTVPNLLIMWK